MKEPAETSGSPSRQTSWLWVGALVALLAGLALMLPFEATLTRILGVAALFAFIVLGLPAIAEPGFLEADADEDVETR